VTSQLAGGPPLAAPHRTIIEALVDAARARAPWLHFHEGRSTTSLDAASALHLARAWAARLVEAGVQANDRVAILAPSGPTFVGAFLGAQAALAVPVPLAWPVIGASAPRLLASLAPQLCTAAPAAVVTTDAIAPLIPPVAPILTAPSASSRAEAAVDPEAPAFIQFTSGTTSSPRGAVISQRAAVASAWAMGRALGLHDRDVGCSWIPLFHDMGLVGTLLSALFHRVPMHIMAPAEFLLRPERWIERMATVGATITVAPNFGYATAARRVAARELPSLRVALSGSEPVHRATIDAFEDRFAVPSRGSCPSTASPSTRSACRSAISPVPCLI
jgi:acyl-CoA synthetase (AMP-forming)/AMP-acid ligase II